MTDLYALLDVPRNASKEQIRKAYRDKAKTMHPDAGGDSAAFAQLCRAHDVLCDDEARAHYDQTGSADGIGNVRAEAVQMIALAFARFVEEMMAFRPGINLMAINPQLAALPSILNNIKKRKKEAEDLTRDMQSRVESVKTARLQIKPKDEGKDPLGAIFDHMARQIDGNLAKAQFQVKCATEALSILSLYESQGMPDRGTFATAANSGFKSISA